MTEPRNLHREFLNRYYGVSRHFYDVTRKYYLFGRDEALSLLLEDSWERMIDVGVGTGRNLRKLREQRPNAQYGGIDASDAMLDHARKRCPWASLMFGFAEDVVYRHVFDAPPDRILFSYCLSMVSDPAAAIQNARKSLAPGGQVVIVDFSTGSGLPGPVREALHRWLRTFHVKPLDPALFEQEPISVKKGPFDYYRLVRLGPLA